MTLQEVIARDYTLQGNGRFLKTEEHNSLVIDTVKQIFYWNSKKLSGTIVDWFKWVKHEPCDIKLDIFDSVVEKDATVVDTVDVDLVNLFHDNVDSSDYWIGYRGYTKETINKFKLGYTGEWNTLPIYEGGKFVNFQCRTNTPKKLIKHWYRGSAPHTFNFSILPFVRDYLIVTESPVDAIMLDQHGIPAVSQTAGAGNTILYAKNILKFAHIKNLILVYDNDDAGVEGSLKVMGIFGDRARTFTFPGFSPKYDVTDYFKDGHTKKDFLSLIGL